jgi:transposase
LNHLLDHELDLRPLDARFCNDASGSPAYPPATLLKLILFACSQGIVSSRGIEDACRTHVTFIALSGDSAAHFTTVAGFIRELGEQITDVFTQVLFICDAQGLIGREMFAIDGVKLPRNASKAKCVCGPCELRDQCLRYPERSAVRQVVFFTGKNQTPESHTQEMKRRIDSEAGRSRYAQRLGTVEPVFGNIRRNKRLNRFTLRGRRKVDTQWKLFCLVHNIEKLAHHGYAQ